MSSIARGIHFGIYALWNDPAEDRQQTAWVRKTWDAVQPYVPGRNARASFLAAMNRAQLGAAA